MSDIQDEKAFHILEKAVYSAQTSLERTTQLQPFIMLLNDAGKIEVFENEIKNALESYSKLEETLKKRVAQGDVDILVLCMVTDIPDKLSKDISKGIRLHFEEKNQIDKKIGARFLYIPYTLHKTIDSSVSVQLYSPIPVGFPAEYIVK